MERRFDAFPTTAFGDGGRLYQVEFAKEAVNNMELCIGILARDGVVLAVKNKITSKLIDPHAVMVNRSRIFKIADHIACSLGGLVGDGRVLIDICRRFAQKYYYKYLEPVPVEQLVKMLCDKKQEYTQSGGRRPFGVSLIYAGWDSIHGFQLYLSDPSGNYEGWRATAIGLNYQVAENFLKTNYKKSTSTQEAAKTALKAILKTKDNTSITAEKLELATLKMVEANSEVIFINFEVSELQAVLDSVQ